MHKGVGAQKIQYFSHVQYAHYVFRKPKKGLETQNEFRTPKTGLETDNEFHSILGFDQKMRVLCSTAHKTLKIMLILPEFSSLHEL